jgi:hypothetical protein
MTRQQYMNLARWFSMGNNPYYKNSQATGSENSAVQSETAPSEAPSQSEAVKE